MGVLVDHTVIGRSFRVDFNALLSVQTAEGPAVCGEAHRVGPVVAPFNGRPSGNTTSHDTSHCGGRSER